MKAKQKETLRINNLLQQLDKNNGYFEVICEALNIDHDSRLNEILAAINNLMSSNGWVSIDKDLPQNDFNVIGCCDDDVFECHHYDDGAFDDCMGEPIKVEFWMDLPQSYYQIKDQQGK